MNLDNEYQSIIKELSSGKRVQKKISPSDIEKICQTWKSSLEANDLTSLRKVLCIFDHTKSTSKKVEELLIKTLNKIDDSELLALCLGTAHFHVIEHNALEGNRPPYNFVETLKKIIDSKRVSKEPELLEWSLRTIDLLGGQSRIFKDRVLALRSPIKSLFNKQHRTCFQLISYLEEKWQQ
ncbi:MAG: hypothetical protein ACPGJV_14685 [Bacteriovoracaceae bacterium]